MNPCVSNLKFHSISRLIILFCILMAQSVLAQKKTNEGSLEKYFHHPTESAKPWVFWYWMHGAVSKAGISADLAAMKQAGIGGAYLMPIKDTMANPPFQPSVRQLSKEWFEMVRFAMHEADRLNLKIGIHFSDGFALAGGPWITPALSMQKLVFSKIKIKGGKITDYPVQQPIANENYYQDIALYAYPDRSENTATAAIPLVSNSKGVNADFLLTPHSKESFRADSAAWIQYQYQQPFTCRAIIIRTNGNNYQSHRLWIKSSNDGIHFTTVTRLESPRHGWQDTDADVTHVIPATTAKYFRFEYDKSGSEAGSEDLDNAKWKPVLKVSGIELLSAPTIHQYESKNGEVWRLSKRTTAMQLPDSLCIPANQLINISNHFKNGNLSVDLPDGNWIILRIGHTSTGHKNETAGAGKGLECDKFNPDAITLQFNQWFGKIYKETGSALAQKVLTTLHVDSWECGSQNWSRRFPEEFKRRRGYDLMPFLPVMAGVPVETVAKTEKILFDIRQTIAELVNDVFYQTVSKLAKSKGCTLSAESVAPTMLSDGMLHYSKSDWPMGEFWLNSPTHDKPNDMSDAISGAHVYGKKTILSESFTTLRMSWDEHPGMLKAIGDRNFAAGINKMVFHVFTHNPLMNQQPGYTLDGVGLYFQRNQTWFKQSKAWIDYITRCQAMLQTGKPVIDIAVYTGDELPRRSILPDRLVNTMPGIFGTARIVAEQKRLANTGEPLRTIPDGVTHSANMADPENWVNALNGYKYDSFNPDALIRLAKVENGHLVLPGGAVYRLLVLPSSHQMNPGHFITTASAQKIIQLVKEGLTVLMDSSYQQIIHLAQLKFKLKKKGNNEQWIAVCGKGQFLLAPYQQEDFTAIKLDKDLIISDNEGKLVSQSDIAFTHRVSGETHIYFIANQQNKQADFQFSFRVNGKKPELWDAVTGRITEDCNYRMEKGRTKLQCSLDANASVFVVFRNNTKQTVHIVQNQAIRHDSIVPFNQKSWVLQFDSLAGGPRQPLLSDTLVSWTAFDNPQIKYYSGTAVYKNSFTINSFRKYIIQFSEIHDIATVRVNGRDCGVIWTAPYQADISHAVKVGNNTIEIELTNTWHNRLIGDHGLPAAQRITFTTAPYRLEGKPLSVAGIVGTVKIRQE